MKKAMIFSALALGMISAANSQTVSTPEEKRDVLLSTCTDERCRAFAREITGTMTCADDAPIWKLTRRVDPISDAKSCAVTMAHSGIKAGLMVAVIEGDLSVSVLGKDYPGRDKAVRVDSNEAMRFKTALHDGQARSFLAQLRSGSTVKTRIIEWPSGAPLDYSAPVCDLPVLVDDCLK